MTVAARAASDEGVAPRRRSLRNVLARQWMAFALLLFAGFAAMALLLLYLLEDAFIDRRLRDVAASVRVGATELPPGFERVDRATAPAALRERTAGQRDPFIREFRLPDGRYVHVLAGRDRRGAEYLLVYDVSDQLRVNAVLRQSWLGLFAIALLLVLIARSISARSSLYLARQANELVLLVAAADGPARLRALAAQAEIVEFARLATLAADAWEPRIAALENERETLAFLGHELRTPLQSARTSLALLQADRSDAAAWDRLQRAQERLARASQAILWLGSATPPPDGARCDAGALAQALAGEFAPLAAARGQRIVVAAPAGTMWPLPAEIAETVLANLLQNAIQHGDRGDVVVSAEPGGFAITNPAGQGEVQVGFGLGLVLVRRLLTRCGWTVDGVAVDGGFIVRGRRAQADSAD